jgi:hypothetical protein
MICPICKKGELINLVLLTCCVCGKMWTEYEFLAECKKAGLAYYFTPDIHGQIVIYDPKIEQHEFIEKRGQ